MDSLLGITFSDWMGLLRDNHFAVDRRYWKRAALLSLLSLLNSQGRRRENRRYGAALSAAQVSTPLFIIGHWRSGTTLLHELISLDGRFAYPTLFQVSNPHTFLIREQKAAQALAARPANERGADGMRVSFKSPGEEEHAISIACQLSPMIGWAFPRRDEYYDRYLTLRGVPAEEIARWQETFLTFLKKMSLRDARPLVLKSPPHTGRIRLLLEMFPDAKFVHIRRNPYVVFQSTLRLYEKAAVHSYFQDPDREQLIAGILRRYALMYEAYFEERSLIPEGQFCEVSFEELERDIPGQVRAVYEQLDLGGFEQLEPKLREYVTMHADYRRNEHAALPEEMSERIAREWKRSFEEWGYAR